MADRSVGVLAELPPVPPTALGRRSAPAPTRGGEPTVRRRLLAAVVDQSSVVGFHQVKVSDLCGLCRISRRTFYDYFPDVEQLFVAAYGELDRELRRDVLRAWTAGDRDPAAALAALVAFAAADPVRADAYFVQALAAGLAVADRRRRTLEWLATLMAPDAGDRAPWAVEIACGGVWDVIRSRVAAGDVSGLRRDAAALVAAAAGR